MPPGPEIDTSSQDWLMACLARHICHLPNKVARHEFLNRMRPKKSPEFMQEIEQRVKDEWVLMYPQSTFAKELHGHA
jgi:hypothetical protein